jgi:hypothetical protein
VRLARAYGAVRIDAASLRALEIGARKYGAVKSILEKSSTEIRSIGPARPVR